MEPIVCPACGRNVQLAPDPAHPGYASAYCPCNPVGPVLQQWIGEPPAAPAAPEKKTQKGEE